MPIIFDWFGPCTINAMGLWLCNKSYKSTWTVMIFIKDIAGCGIGSTLEKSHR